MPPGVLEPADLYSHSIATRTAYQLSAEGPVGEFPQHHVNGARDLLHLLVINLIGRVAGTVVVFVFSVKEENYGDAFTRVVVMIAPEEEPVWIVGIVVAIIVGNIQILLCSQLRSTHPVRCSSSSIQSRKSLIRPGELFVPGIRITFLSAATNVDIKLRHDLIQGMVG